MSPSAAMAGDETFRAALRAMPRGQISRAEAVLGEYPDGQRMVSPVIVAVGGEPGPTLWVQACVHGPEVGGILGIQAFLKALSPAELKGRIICLLVANPTGFRSGQRLTPQDGANLNRAFPGSPDGGTTQQLADGLFRLAGEHADVMLDLHSGGDHAVSAHYAIFTDEGGAAGARSRSLAAATGAPFIWNAPSKSLGGAAYLAFADGGKPAVLFESGGGAQVTPADIASFARAIGRTCIFLNMLPGEAPAERPVEGRDVQFLRARRGGIFIASTQPNSVVAAGAPLGRIVDVLGDVAESFASPFGPAMVTALRRPCMVVHPGDEVLSLVKLTSDPGS